MIDAIDQALKGVLEEEIAQSTRDSLGQKLSVTFEAPSTTGERSKNPTINLYLHEVTENTKHRLDPYQVVRRPGEAASTRKRSRVKMDLCYLLTAQGPDSSTEHRLLTHALGALLRNPVIPDRFLKGSEYETEAHVFVAQPSGDGGEHSHTDVWQSLGANLRASLAVRVTASFDPFETFEVRVVKEMIIGLGLTHEGGVEGRPRDVSGTRVSSAGIVTDSLHQPLVGATVRVHNRLETATTDDRGFFYLTNLPPGPQKLEVGRRGYRAINVKVDVPQPGRVNELEPLLLSLAQNESNEDALREADMFPLAPAAAFYDSDRHYPETVAGKLVLEDGKIAAFVPVRMGDQRSVTDAEGRYRFFERKEDEKVYATYPGLGEIEVKVNGGQGVVSASVETGTKK